MSRNQQITETAKRVFNTVSICCSTDVFFFLVVYALVFEIWLGSSHKYAFYVYPAIHQTDYSLILRNEKKTASFDLQQHHCTGFDFDIAVSLSQIFFILITQNFLIE